MRGAASGLLTASVALAVVIAAELGIEPARPEPEALWNSVVPAAALAIKPPAHDGAAEAVLARPLFHPDRRPFQPDLVEHSTPSRPTDPVPRLTGTVVMSSGRHALFASDTNRRPVVVTEGDWIDAWRVERIQAGRVVLIGAAGTLDIFLSADAATVRDGRRGLRRHKL